MPTQSLEIGPGPAAGRNAAARSAGARRSTPLLRRWLPPLLFLALVALIRDLQGGAESALTPVVTLAVIWFALHGGRVEVLLGSIAAGSVIALPALLTGGPTYPDSELALAVSYVVVLSIAGLATSRLVREREALLADVSQLAHTDSLTGLANRRGWEEMLRRELARSARDGSPLSVAIVDLDRFKEYNDRSGHAAGDRLLRESAARWAEQVRAMDGIARYGGEEFAFLLPGASLRDAAGAIERVRAATPAGVTASGGVAQWDRAEDAATLLARADRALYEAKRGGRDRVSLAAATSAPPPAPKERAAAER